MGPWLWLLISFVIIFGCLCFCFLLSVFCTCFDRHATNGEVYIHILFNKLLCLPSRHEQRLDRIAEYRNISREYSTFYESPTNDVIYAPTPNRNDYTSISKPTYSLVNNHKQNIRCCICLDNNIDLVLNSCNHAFCSVCINTELTGVCSKLCAYCKHPYDRSNICYVIIPESDLQSEPEIV